MLWVLIETVLRAPKTYVKIDGLENIHNFTLKFFVYVNLCILTFSVLSKACRLHDKILFVILISVFFSRLSNYIVHDKFVL